MADLVGGRTNYGQALGIIMLKTSFARIPGDIGNASTFSFPVRYRVVEEATPIRVVEEADRALLPLIIEAAKELEKEGVKAITTSCGFMVIFQQELANSVKVPVFTSSLLQVPLAHQMISEDQKVGIITANSEYLTKKHLRAAGIDDSIAVAIAGMEKEEEFRQAICENPTRPLEPEKIGNKLVTVCKRLKEKECLGAIVFECTNLAPYAQAVQENIKLPIFDIVTLATAICNVVIRKKFEGFL